MSRNIRISKHEAIETLHHRGGHYANGLYLFGEYTNIRVYSHKFEYESRGQKERGVSKI